MDSTQEKRSDTRFHHETGVIFEKDNSGKYFTARMHNFSKNGMYLESKFSPRQGSDLYLSLEKSPFKKEFDFFHAKVKWSRSISLGDDTTFGIGVKLQHAI